MGDSAIVVLTASRTASRSAKKTQVRQTHNARVATASGHGHDPFNSTRENSDAPATTLVTADRGRPPEGGRTARELHLGHPPPRGRPAVGPHPAGQQPA